MSAESNKALARRLLDEAFNAGNIDVVDELVTTDFVNHDAALPEALIGPDAAKASIQGYRSAFPDLRITIEEQIADDQGRRDALERQGHSSGRPDGNDRDGQAGDRNRDHARSDRGRPDRRKLDELGHARDAAAARRRARPGHHRLRRVRGGVALRGPSSAAAHLPISGRRAHVSLAPPPPAHALPRMWRVGCPGSTRASRV